MLANLQSRSCSGPAGNVQGQAVWSVRSPRCQSKVRRCPKADTNQVLHIRGTARRGFGSRPLNSAMSAVRVDVTGDCIASRNQEREWSEKVGGPLGVIVAFSSASRNAQHTQAIIRRDLRDRISMLRKRTLGARAEVNYT